MRHSLPTTHFPALRVLRLAPPLLFFLFYIFLFLPCVCFLPPLNDAADGSFTALLTHTRISEDTGPLQSALREDRVMFESQTQPTFISCDPHCRHVFIITTNRSMCSSLLCNMPDGGDQKIGHRGEHMCLAHYPSSFPSSTRYTRLHMLTTGGYFHTSGNLLHSGCHVCPSVASSCFYPEF